MNIDVVDRLIEMGYKHQEIILFEDCRHEFVNTQCFDILDGRIYNQGVCKKCCMTATLAYKIGLNPENYVNDEEELI